MYLDDINLLGAINTIGIEEAQSDLQFALIPNPSSTGNALVSFNLNKSEIIEIEIFDAIGKTILVKQNEKYAAGSHSIELMNNGTTLPRGVYFVRLNTSNSYSIKKLVVQ